MAAELSGFSSLIDDASQNVMRSREKHEKKKKKKYTFLAPLGQAFKVGLILFEKL